MENKVNEKINIQSEVGKKGDVFSPILSKKDLVEAYWRSFLGASSINYERYESLGFLYSMQGALKKIYKNNKEGLKRACQRHLEMFNTHPIFIPMIVGTALAIEEKISVTDDPEERKKLEESVNNVKVGMMAPTAAIGDSLGWATIRPILASIGAGLALSGSIVGPIFFFIAWNIINFSSRYFGMMYGYKKGTSMLKSIKSSMLDKITTGASVLGLTVLGVLTASMVGIKTIIEVTVAGEGGEVVTNVQQMLDGMMPGIIPVILVFALVALMKRGWTSQKVILAIFIIALPLSYFGLFA